MNSNVATSVSDDVAESVAEVASVVGTAVEVVVDVEEALVSLRLQLLSVPTDIEVMSARLIVVIVRLVFMISLTLLIDSCM